MEHADHPNRPTLTLAGLRFGMWAIMPAMPGVLAFAIAVGATAARKSFSFAESVTMNAFVYAGASQLIAFEAWPDGVSLAGLATLAMIAATVNSRMLLMGASLQPWLAPMPAWQAYPLLHLVTDPGWIIAMRYRAEGGRDVGVLLGGGMVVWSAWMVFTSLGYFAGALITDPRAIGLDLIMPIFFATMLIPMWRGSRRAAGWLAAGATALATQLAFGGWWFIVVGAVAGAIVEGWRDDRD